MRASSILNAFLNNVTPSMHKVRRASLSAVLTSLLSGSSLAITSLGRNIHSDTTEKHQIKRSMRICSNPNLGGEILTTYSSVANKIVAQQMAPIILIDWSDLDPRKQHFLLRASIAVEGRSLTLYEKIYTLAEKEIPRTHKAFMTTLKSMLPPNCKPIIVSDAGFRVPWFLLVESLGWDYVGRVKNKTLCRKKEDDEWGLKRELYSQATSRPKHLGRFIMRRKNSFESHLVVYKKRGRGRKHLTADGVRVRRSSQSKSSAAREQEPWLLATSLETTSLKKSRKIVNIYSTRMQIEESFRNLKTGLKLNECKTRTLANLSILLMIGMLAQYILFMFGVMAKQSGKHLKYQANSTKKKAVLSYQFIGLKVYRDRKYKFTIKDWLAAIEHLKEIMKISTCLV